MKPPQQQARKASSDFHICRRRRTLAVATAGLWRVSRASRARLSLGNGLISPPPATPKETQRSRRAGRHHPCVQRHPRLPGGAQPCAEAEQDPASPLTHASPGEPANRTWATQNKNKHHLSSGCCSESWRPGAAPHGRCFPWKPRCLSISLQWGRRAAGKPVQ